MSLNTRQYKYKVLSLDLTAVRAEVSQGLTKKINTFTILTLDGGDLEFKLNSNTDDAITGSDGLKIEGYPITDIYWTHAAQAGLTAKVFIAWID